MSTWPRWLDAALVASDRAVLVSVTEVRGSTPREPGAKMVVSADGLRGTIGGGNLEHKAAEIARVLLGGDATAPALRRFPLGPGLGQCCGGVAWLAFEPLAAPAPAWLAPLDAALVARVPVARVVRLDARGGAMLVTARGADGSLGSPALDAEAVRLARDALRADAAPVSVVRPGRGRSGEARLLVERVAAPRMEVVVFGAGHVGKALVQVLGTLPWRVTWVDPRAEEFPREVPANVEMVVDRAPERLVARGPAGASWIVTTHSHPLDFALCEQVLTRGDARYCGMIGSATKRRRLERRLRDAGIGEHAIASLTCPIGLEGIDGKHPGEIAVAVAAELLRGEGAAHPDRHRRAARTPLAAG